MTTLPKHLAIIMDGNGRWAAARGRPRTYGHLKGTRVAKRIITDCSRLGVQWLTLYAFSSENWFRPTSEVGVLMRILKRYLSRETGNLIRENIRLTVVGEMHRLPADVAKAVRSAVEATRSCTGMNLVFCLSYGSRQELTSAAKELARAARDGRIDPDRIDESEIARALWTWPAPDPDLIIRTSGEQRLSNFLLWQAAYSEFWFTDKTWPDFDITELEKALIEFSTRRRRYGRVESNDEKLRDTIL